MCVYICVCVCAFPREKIMGNAENFPFSFSCTWKVKRACFKMLVKMAAPRKCLSYALNRLLISNIYLSYATPGGTNKAQLLGDINSILFPGIFGCRRAQMLTVPKLPERKSFQQLLMSVQSCLTCYELPAAVKQQKQQSNSNSNNNKTSMGNQKYIFVMASAISPALKVATSAFVCISLADPDAAAR